MRRWLVAVTGMLAAAAVVADEVPEGASVYIGATTNGLFRGVSQTTDQTFYHQGGMGGMTGKGGMGSTSTTTSTDSDMFAPAVYGGFDYLHRSGFYGSIDATTVDIPDFDAFARAEASGGYLHHFDSGWRLDGGVIGYTYLGESGSNFWEVYAGAGYGPVSGKIWHDPDNNNVYYMGQLHFDIGSGVQLYLSAGHYSLDVGPDYDDFGAWLSRAFGPLTVGGGISDTSIDSAIVYLYASYRIPL
jgi:uncharacterized protein (TIGR02001 family)